MHTRRRLIAAAALASAVAGCAHRRQSDRAQPPGPTWRPQGAPPPVATATYAPPARPPAPDQGAPPPAWPFPFPMPPGLTLPPPPAGWAIPGLPWPTPAAPGTPSPVPPSHAPPPASAGPAPDALGVELADRINAYRESRGLPRIPRSRALGRVAATHVRDQEQQRPDTGSCNQHSWSSAGPWTPCCYTADHAQAACMWKKPAEISGFGATGYEISVRSSDRVSPAEAVASWQSSPEHHAVMINGGTWSKRAWRSLGTAVMGGHAVAWFAEEADPSGGF
ncbi:MAG: hypothetical protein IT374_06585 [Polyangiaceae bacterium]|nr:hypothetical protein [Polyangiaceae bacterium]